MTLIACDLKLMLFPLLPTKPRFGVKTKNIHNTIAMEVVKTEK